jgi:hypothetical protein
MLGRLTPRLAVSPLALAALAITGCSSSSSSSSGNGVSSKSPTEILAASKAAADSAGSVHVAGTLANNGTRITLNLSLASGQGGRGQISQNGLSFKLIVVGDTIYIKGSPAFYSHFGGTAATRLFQGKWLKAPASGGELGSLAALTNFGQLIDPRPSPERPPSNCATPPTTARCSSRAPASPTRSRSSSTAPKPGTSPSPTGTSRSRSQRPPARSTSVSSSTPGTEPEDPPCAEQAGRTAIDDDIMGRSDKPAGRSTR